MILVDINQQEKVLNGICPYFTMFPLEFPYSILSQYASKGSIVLDPFCGRGTTSYAARILGLNTYGIDSNPVAVAISEAKLANTSPTLIMKAAKSLLDEVSTPSEVPEGEDLRGFLHRMDHLSGQSGGDREEPPVTLFHGPIRIAAVEPEGSGFLTTEPGRHSMYTR